MESRHKTLWQEFEAQVAQGGQRSACWYKVRDRWREISWLKWRENTQRLARHLRTNGIGPGDRVAIVSAPRFEWTLCDLALMQLGAVSVAISISMDPEQVRAILLDHEVRFALVDTPSSLALILTGEKTLQTGVRGAVYFDARVDEHTLDELVGWPIPEEVEALEVILEQNEPLVEFEPPLPSGLATIVYTAGTSEPAKPVPLSHHELLLTATALARRLQLTRDDVQLVVLPLSHIFGRSALYAAMTRGAVIAFSTGISHLLDDMNALRPTLVVSVPRVYERLSTRILSDALASNPLRRGVLNWAIRVGGEAANSRVVEKTPGYVLKAQAWVAYQFIFRRLHQHFGGRLRFFVSVGGSMSNVASQFFIAAGLEVLEGYGLTEFAGLTHIGTPGRTQPNSVGRALDHIETRIENGEIQLKLRGRVADESRWFSTRDMGSINQQGLLEVTGRRSAVVDLKGGEQIASPILEQRLRAEPDIDQLVVLGDGRPFLTGLLTLDPESMNRWALEYGLEQQSIAEISQDHRVYNHLQALVTQYNEGRPLSHQIQKFAVLEAPLSRELGELTDLLEIRRPVIIDRYAHIIRSFYEEQY